MIPEDHRVQLSAYRRDRSTDDQAELIDALNTAGDDPELAEWLDNEQEFDNKFRASLAQFKAPDELLLTILTAAAEATATGESSAASRSATMIWWKHPAFLSAAASIAVLLMIGVLFLKPQTLEASSELPDLYSHVTAHAMTVKDYDLRTQELDSIHDFLVSHNVPSPDRYPRGGADLVPFGCETFDWRGRSVTGICLRSTATDKIVHLYIAHRADFPNDSHPTQAQIHPAGDNLSMAVWACNTKIYVFIVRGSIDDLHQLL